MKLLDQIQQPILVLLLAALLALSLLLLQVYIFIIINVLFTLQYIISTDGHWYSMLP